MDEVGWIKGVGVPWGFQCSYCIHLDENWSKPKCAAYPEGIPTAVLYNRADHRYPLPGDHGIRFEGRDGQESPLAGRERHRAEEEAADAEAASAETEEE
jgi:hypothetical protein